MTGYPQAYDRPSTPPVAMSTGSTSMPMRVPSPLLGRGAWASMSSYLAAGVALGLLMIVGLTVMRSSEPKPAPGVVTDNVVRLGAREIGARCWSGAAKDGPARVTVAFEVGLDGKVRYAAASGESPAMRGCVESHVKAWEFLPQAQAQAMVVPFQIDRR